MRASEFTDHRVMAKIEKTGQIVQILRHEDEVGFSDDTGWFLVNTEPGRRTGTGIKWIPDNTRFTWVKNFESLKERKTQNYQGIDMVFKDFGEDVIQIRAQANGRDLGYVTFVQQGDTLLPQDLEVDERYRGQGIAAAMYDYAKSLGYRIRRSGQQTAAGAGFWQKHRPGQNVWESQRRLPAAIEEFLDSLNPDDCGVEDIGAYRIHFEGFTSDCKSSADYRRNPEAVYQQVYQDFIQREGGQQPLIQDMVGDERFPILYSIFRRKRTVAENRQATARQVLNYINKTHHEPFRPGEKMYAAVMAHPRWQLKRVPLLNLNIPDQEYDDVDYDEYEPESDPYGRVMVVDPEHAGRVSQHLIDKQPIVIDADRYIIDGNHRAWAAKYLLNRDYINAWVPVEQIKEDQEEYLYHATYRPLLKSIKTKGLGNTTQSQWIDSQPGVVYLARDPEVARSYAEAAESVPEEWLDQIVVLQISKSKLNPKLLHRDRNVQDNTGDTLEYHAVIPANLLSVNKLNEVNYPDELTVSDKIQQYFFKRGYELAGEGRDQMAFESPRGTIVKVLGTGETEREDIVKNYVKFFQRHQRNPYYPRIYSSGNFTVDDETYFVYEMEYLTYVSDEEEVLEYIEDLMASLAQNGARGVAAFQQNRPLPKSLSAQDVAGLVKATYDLETAIGGQAPLDLSQIENIRRRSDGHLVIMDPYSL